MIDDSQTKEKMPFHVILKNFIFDDFQFKGEIVNSGFKMYRNKQNFMEKNFLLIECEISKNYYKKVSQLLDEEKYDQDDEIIELSS